MNQSTLKKWLSHLIPNVGTIVVVALMLFSYNVWAAPSAQSSTTAFPYQGTLMDAQGTPITGDIDMTFRLYDADSGGTALWEEAHASTNAVPVTNGLFQVMLGSLMPIPNSIWGNGAVYLGVQIGNDPEMTPREMIGSVPSAVKSYMALTVPNGSITQIQAPGLVAGPEDGVKIQYGEIRLDITTSTSLITKQLVFDVDFSEKPKIILQPYSNFTTGVTATIGGSTCDGHSCGVRVHRLDGNTWQPGEYVIIQWVAIGR